MRLRILPILLALGAAVALPTASAASCVGFESLEDHLEMAGAVFVGTVVDVTNGGRTASVAVEEVWRGPALATSVVVHGGPDQGNVWSSVERSYAAGTRYLFAADVADGRLVDSICSPTQPWSDELAALRPVDAAGPLDPQIDDQTPGVPLAPIGIGLGIIVLGSIGVLAVRSRH